MTPTNTLARAQAVPTQAPCALPRLERAHTAHILSALKSAGCAIVEDAAPLMDLSTVRDELEPWFKDALNGEGLFFGRRTKRFSGILAKAPAVSALALNEPILSAIRDLLLGGPGERNGDCIQLNLLQAIEIGAGEPAQYLHRDDDLFPFDKRGEVMANVMWPLDDFTEENGATILVPGSHRNTTISPSVQHPIGAGASAGSAIVWLGSLLHGGGANKTARPRRGLVISYSLAWLAPAEKLLLSVPSDAARSLPRPLQRLLGYQIHRPNLGWVEGRDPIEWLDGEMGPLAPARDNLTPEQQAFMDQLVAESAQ